MDSEDPFLLPNASSRELQLDRLRSQLDELKKKKKDLKRQLAEAKLTSVMTSTFAIAIQDPRTQKAVDMKEVQKKIMNDITTATESRYKQQVLSNFRLCGWTTFNFRDDYIGYRIDTFYNRRYYEPYYIFLLKDDPITIHQHTFPAFIPVTQIGKTFLPDRIDSMLRVLQDFILAFVSRREQIKKLQKHLKKKKVSIEVSEAANFALKIIRPMENGGRCFIDIQYKVMTSMYPSEVLVDIVDENHNIEDLDNAKIIASTFKSKRLLQAYRSLF